MPPLDASSTLDASTTPDASENPDEFGVTVELSGEGTGTVSSSPAGIDCPGDCENDYANSTSLTLTATPSIGSRFAGWSGGGCLGTNPCVVTVSAATNVTAAFALSTVDLTVTKDGTGTGSEGQWGQLLRTGMPDSQANQHTITVRKVGEQIESADINANVTLIH